MRPRVLYSTPRSTNKNGPEGPFLFVVVGVDPGSISSSWKHANTRSDPAKGCGTVLVPAVHSPPAVIFRIYPILPIGSIHSRIPNLRGL